MHDSLIVWSSPLQHSCSVVAYQEIDYYIHCTLVVINKCRVFPANIFGAKFLAPIPNGFEAVFSPNVP